MQAHVITYQRNNIYLPPLVAPTPHCEKRVYSTKPSQIPFHCSQSSAATPRLKSDWKGLAEKSPCSLTLFPRWREWPNCTKWREGERESVDFVGVRSLFRRVPGRFVLQWERREESPQRALSGWENHVCQVLWIPRLNLKKQVIL